MTTDRSRRVPGLKDLDEAVPPLTRALTGELRNAHASTDGMPYPELINRIQESGKGVLGKSALSRIFSPNPNPGKQRSLEAWRSYAAVLSALGEDPDEYRDRWQAAQEEWAAQIGGHAPDEIRPQSAKRTRLPYWIGSAALVAAAVALLVWQPWSAARTPVASSPQSRPEPVAVLVTGTPPVTIQGVIVRTYHAGEGSIGVRVFPTPYSNAGGQNGPRPDGAEVDVVCHVAGGRMVHEDLEPPGKQNSAGWDQVYYENHLYYVSDHYLAFPGGVQPKACPA
ncbi:MAG TPA: hypothetical protein VG756_23760 [Pseudonocardiaceae bacterium]|jgi:hypothetical protein|nr:hypothetical protein [Pseudonocardiaceae bacterium]